MAEEELFESPVPPDVERADCPECRNAAPTPLGKFARPEHITDRATVLGWNSLERSTNRKHHVDPNAIVVTYQLTKTTMVTCSLGHEHARGAIVITRCGRTLLLGWKCAQNAVHGSDELKAYAEQAEAHMRKVARVKRRPGECHDRLAKIVPVLERAQALKDNNSGTAYGREMYRRAASGSPRDAEVTFTTTAMKKQKATDLGKMDVIEVDDVGHIKGLSLWTTDIGVEAARRALAQAAELIADAREFDAEDLALIGSLDRRSISLDAATTRAESHFEICQQFLGEGNLRLAMLAARQAAA
jgi:hypothetical protein